MTHSFTKIYVHITFHIKNKEITVREEERMEMYKYMTAIIKDNDSVPIIVNGVDDHVHIFCIMSKNIALAKLVEQIKKKSSKWIKTKNAHYQQFAWQVGYAGFSVSPSVYDTTVRYIERQEEHHKKVTSKAEYDHFLKIHNESK